LRIAAAFDPPNQPDEALDPVLGEDGRDPAGRLDAGVVAEYVGGVTAAVVRPNVLAESRSWLNGSYVKQTVTGMVVGSWRRW
jgi:hypothetical protein